jgi:hypothetical protein
VNKATGAKRRVKRRKTEQDFMFTLVVDALIPGSQH